MPRAVQSSRFEIRAAGGGTIPLGLAAALAAAGAVCAGVGFGLARPALLFAGAAAILAALALFLQSRALFSGQTLLSFDGESLLVSGLFSPGVEGPASSLREALIQEGEAGRALLLFPAERQKWLAGLPPAKQKQAKENQKRFGAPVCIREELFLSLSGGGAALDEIARALNDSAAVALVSQKAEGEETKVLKLEDRTELIAAGAEARMIGRSVYFRRNDRPGVWCCDFEDLDVIAAGADETGDAKEIMLALVFGPSAVMVSDRDPMFAEAYDMAAGLQDFDQHLFVRAVSKADANLLVCWNRGGAVGTV